MAKKPKSPVETLRALPPSALGTARFEDTLSDQQRQWYQEFIKLVRELPTRQRPSYTAMMEAMEAAIGTAPSERTLRKAIRAT